VFTTVQSPTFGGTSFDGSGRTRSLRGGPSGDRSERSAQRPDHRPCPGTSQCDREGRVLDGRLPAEAGRDVAGQRQALRRGLQPRAEARNGRHRHGDRHLPRQRSDDADRCGRRLPHASRVRRRLERLGRDRGGQSGGPVDHGAGRDEPGRLADRRPVAGGVRGRRRDADQSLSYPAASTDTSPRA